MTYRFVIAEGTFSAPDVENDHAAAAGYDVAVSMAPMRSPEETAAATADADAVIVTTNPMPAEHIDSFGAGVRILGRAGIGLDAIDLAHAAERGIPVVNFPDYCTAEVATHAVAMLLALGRRIPEGDRVARSAWSNWSLVGDLAAVDSWTVGVVGCGRIGRATIERLRPLVKEIRTFDPYATDGIPGTTTCESLDALLEGADAVTLHIPLTPDTRSILGARELSLLRRGAAVVNVSRGGLIDEAALADALHSGQVRAALDVVAQEPPADDNPLVGAPNLLLSPHVGWYSETSERRLRQMAVDALVDYLDDRPLRSGHWAVPPPGRRDAITTT